MGINTDPKAFPHISGEKLKLLTAVFIFFMKGTAGKPTLV
jgi:hypothetical protein